jgi:hypothetical protein
MKTTKFSFLLILFISQLFLNCNEDNSQQIETIGGEKITTNKIKTAYETEIDYFSRMQNLEKKNLIEIINKDIDELDEQLKPIHQKFQKKNFYENHRNSLIFRSAADKSGFTSRPEIKEMIKYIENQTIAQLYLQEEIEKKIKISDEDAQNECTRLRTTDKRFVSLPLDKCIQIARGYLKSNQSQAEFQRVMERIKERVEIKHNDKFDLDAYLKNESDLKETDSKPNTPATAPAKP